MYLNFKGVQFLEFVVSIIFLQTIVHIIQSSIEIFIMYFVFNNPISHDNFWTFAITIMIIGYQGMFAGKFEKALIFLYYIIDKV